METLPPTGRAAVATGPDLELVEHGFDGTLAQRERSIVPSNGATPVAATGTVAAIGTVTAIVRFT